MPDPFVVLQRSTWAAMAHNTQIDLDESALQRLRGIGDPTSALDIAEVYRPLTQLLHLRMANTGKLYEQSNAFLGLDVQRTPFVIAVAGSVAVGKSTASRLLREMLRRRRAAGGPAEHPFATLVGLEFMPGIEVSAWRHGREIHLLIG